MHSSLVWRGVRRGVVSCSLKRGQGEGLKRFPGLNKTIASSSSSSSPSSSSSSSLLSSSSSLLPSSCSPLADNFRWFSSSAPKMDEDLAKLYQNYPKRTHNCGELRSANAGENVVLHGWVKHIRLVGNHMAFFVLRDSLGEIQIISSSSSSSLSSEEAALFEKLKSLTPESVVCLSGVVQNRPTDDCNHDLPTGSVEIHLDDLHILNIAEPPLPFVPFQNEEKNQKKNKMKPVTEDTRLLHRYLDLRSPTLQKNLRLRSKIGAVARSFLATQDFVEVETPTLFRSSPEGAREFLVPTRREGEFYSLTQSPQQYKQLLMASGFDRYFQFARCYRDEGISTDRQPEFSQIDMEMSFVNQKDVQDLVENLLREIYSKTLSVSLPNPFPRITYDEAMRRYGSDKPDTRFDLELQNLSSDLQDTKFSSKFRDYFQKDGVEERVYFGAGEGGYSVVGGEGRGVEITGLAVEGLRGVVSNKALGRLVEEAKKAAGVKLDFPLSTIIIRDEDNWGGDGAALVPPPLRASLTEKLNLKPDTVLMVSGSPDSPWYTREMLNMMGKLRLQVAKLLKNEGLLEISSKEFKPMWVVDFPLFEVVPAKELYGNTAITGEERVEAESKTLKSTHHPFTAPHPDDASALLTATTADDLLQIRGQGYDVAMNGVEVGGGSVRNHSIDMQKKIFEILQIDYQNEFDHLLSALKHGCPPHGGLAIGFDRFVAMMCEAETIREVIAFPKTGAGRELMSNSPRAVAPSQLEEYHISVTKKE